MAAGESAKINGFSCVPSGAEVGVGRGISAVEPASAGVVPVTEAPCGDDTGPGVVTEALIPGKVQAASRKIIEVRLSVCFIIISWAPGKNRQYNYDMKQNFFSLLIIIVLIAGGYYIVKTMQETAQQANQALQPLQHANQALQTQVSDLLHPTPTIIPDPVTYINEVRALARLETIQYSVEKVVTCESNQGTFGFVFGDKVLFVGHGVVIAGINMGKIMPEDMRLETGVLSVKLPPAEVFIATLDNQKSYVYDRDTGILVKPTTDLETICRQSAETEILKAAMEDGILTQAQTNAENYLFRFFQSLGYQNVIFVK